MDPQDFILYAKTVAVRELSGLQRDLLEPRMSNWIKVSDILYSKYTTEDRVLAMLFHELETRQRPHIINRVYSRYSNLRMIRERAEIQKCLNNQKKLRNDISTNK